MPAKAAQKKVQTPRSGKVRAETKTSSSRSPRVMRPTVPPSYHFPKSSNGLLDWSWARERLTRSENYVIVTVRPNGRPHAMGMHGVWFDDAYYFGTHPKTRKARNLAANPHCILINEALDELVIVEGAAELISYDSLPVGLSKASKEKYGWPMDPRMGGQVYKITPAVVFAFPLKQIATAVTKWVFD